MEYRVEELAAAAGVRVDTVRFYQTRGLLPLPRRVKRVAVYSQAHLERLRRIRHYKKQGLSLAVIKRLLDGQPSKTNALLAAVAQESGDRLLTRAELASRSGVPEPLLAAAESAGLLRPLRGEGGACYGETDVQIARAAMAILGHGFPLDELFRVALRHARGVEKVADAAVALFDRAVRDPSVPASSPEEVAEAFRAVLPAVTTLVALHFQRVLLDRAVRRLRETGESGVLDAARRVVESARLEVAWR